MELKLDWPGLVKPRVIECMEWLQGGAENGGAVECGWRQPLEEIGACSHLSLRWSQTSCSPEISYDEILIPMVIASIGGTFVRWWSYEDWASSMRWVLLCIRDTQSSRALPPVWGYNKKCVTRRTLHDHTVEIHCHCHKTVIFCYSNPEVLRQYPNNLQIVQ